MNPPKNSDTGNDFRALSELEEEMLATYAQQIEELANKAAEGAKDIDIQLAALLAGAPDGVRTELMKRFRQIQQEHAAEKEGPAVELTPEQQKQLEIATAREKGILALWLSEKTLKKMRELFLANPLMIAQLGGLGEKLRRQGVLVEMERNNRMQELGELGLQQVKAKDFQKEKEKDSGRER